MPITKESYEVHKLLSHVLDKPSISCQDLVKELFPDKDASDQIEILSGSREVIEETLQTQKDGGLPNLIHRLQFCWTVLRLADNTLRKIKKQNPPITTTFHELTELFANTFAFSVTHPCILEKIFYKLGVESNGGFIKQYSSFLKPGTKPSPESLGIQICGREGDRYIDNLRRIIYWIIRKNRYKYVEENEENAIITNFEFLVDDVMKELTKWCRESDLRLYPDLIEEIENQINLWLQYSCLDGDSRPSNISDQVEIAKAFAKENNLRHKIFIQPASQDPEKGKKILELESEVSRYANDNKKLEQELEELRTRAPILEKQEQNVEELPSAKLPNEDVDRDLLECLKIIDSKYSFDVLRSIQLGDEKSVTMKNFIAHFFYGLRKKGLVTYPEKAEFELSYEQSGLFNCIGFEVSPGDVEHVKIENQGWAIKKEGTLFPIRKAVLKVKS